MSFNRWQTLATVPFFLTTPGLSAPAQQPLSLMPPSVGSLPKIGAESRPTNSVSLFGSVLGQKFSLTNEFLFVEEARDSLHYTRRTPTNKEYTLQSIDVSKISKIVTGIRGAAFHKTPTTCDRQLFEILTQLKTRYSALVEEITPVKGINFHMLSQPRANCTYASGSYTLTCSSNFQTYCDATTRPDVTRLHVEASDTGYRDQARKESEKVATGRNQLD